MTETFGEFLRNTRKAKKLTQGQLAKKLGLDQSTISYYEKNEKTPGLDTLENMASILDIDLKELLSASGKYSMQRIDAMLTLNESNEDYRITKDDLIDKFTLVVNGQPATAEEIEEAVRYIAIQRMMKEEKENKDN